MIAKHTPGPWLVDHDTDITGSESSPEIGCVGKVDIAHVYLRAVPGKTEANARLIAAAPDLLEALKAVLNSCLDSRGLADAYKQARAAIAKAEGKQ